MKKLDKHVMTVAAVARALDRSAERVRQLDPELRPTRTAAGHRRYEVAMVERYLAKRG